LNRHSLNSNDLNSHDLKSHGLNRASDGLESVISKALRRAPAEEGVLLAWPVVCGSAVADRTRALRFADGVLQVEVADKGWQRELMTLAPRYLAAINRYCSARVERIEFVVKALSQE
jgi:hypothetical protein